MAVHAAIRNSLFHEVNEFCRSSQIITTDHFISCTQNHTHPILMLLSLQLSDNIDKLNWNEIICAAAKHDNLTLLWHLLEILQLDFPTEDNHNPIFFISNLNQSSTMREYLIHKCVQNKIIIKNPHYIQLLKENNLLYTFTKSGLV